MRNGTVLTFDDATQSIKVLRNVSVLIEDGRIAAISEDIETPTDVEVIDVTGKILTPGFVNTHSHMWQTALKTLAPNATLSEYFTHYGQYSPTIKSFSAEDVYLSSLAGYYEGLNGGVTSYVEHAHNCWSIDAVKRGYDAAVDSGARIWWCASVEDRDDCSAQETTGYMRSLARQPLVTPGLAYDDLGTASPDQVEKTKEIVKTLDLAAITVHYLGGPWPIGHGSPVVAAKNKFQDLGVPLIFSHGGFNTESDRDALRQHDWHLSITPESEMLFGHGQSTSHRILDQASLGIDTNWTFSGDILTQSRLLLQSIRGTNYTKLLKEGYVPRQSPMAVEDAFLLATRQGGRAVHDDTIGVLKAGAKADIVVFDAEGPNMAGWTDAVAAIILHANVGDIRHVLVNGEFRKRDGKLILTRGDWEGFGKKFADIARRIQRENAGPRDRPEGKMFGMTEYADVEVVSTRRPK